jgi:hypothetical protein
MNTLDGTQSGDGVMAAAEVLKTSAERRGGSTPPLPTYCKLLVCGDRGWQDDKMIYSVLCELKKEYGITTIIEGEASGADRAGASAARKLDLTLKPFPAQWLRYGRAAGPNRQMLKDNPDLVVAFHDDLKNSKGTKNMCQIAILGGVKTLHCFHIDGGWDVRELKLEDATNV